MTKSQEYLNEQAEVAQILRDGIARGLGTPGLADLILQSDWLKERMRAQRDATAREVAGIAESIITAYPQRVVQMRSKRPSGDAA